jgi:hypothetical protein
MICISEHARYSRTQISRREVDRISLQNMVLLWIHRDIEFFLTIMACRLHTGYRTRGKYSWAISPS